MIINFLLFRAPAFAVSERQHNTPITERRAALGPCERADWSIPVHAPGVLQQHQLGGNVRRPGLSRIRSV